MATRHIFLVFVASALAVRAQSPPTAHFTLSAQGRNLNDGQHVTLTAPLNGTATVNFTSVSTPGTAGIASYQWKNNGITICSDLPDCSAPLSAATNTISLTVTDVHGLSSTATSQVDVNFQRGPTAHLSMTAEGQVKTDGQTLTLKARVDGTATVNLTSTSSQGGATITNYVWKRNDNTICFNASCTVSFGTAVNTISLTVTDENGQSSTATGLVNVKPVP